MLIELGRISEETRGPRFTHVNLDGKVLDADLGDYYVSGPMSNPPSKVAL